MSTETTPLSNTPATTLRRHRERGQADRAALYEVLDAGLICHLGVIADGTPVVLPTAYGRDGDTLYLHGSSANGAFLSRTGSGYARPSRTWTGLSPRGRCSATR